jgi:hypothetical protein
MSNWDLMMPGMGLTAIGLAGVTISYMGLAHTFGGQQSSRRHRGTARAAQEEFIEFIEFICRARPAS